MSIEWILFLGFGGICVLLAMLLDATKNQAKTLSHIEDIVWRHLNGNL